MGTDDAVEIEATEDTVLDEEAPAEGEEQPQEEENMDDAPSNNGVNGDGDESKPESTQEDADKKEDKNKEDELILDGDDDEFTVVDEVSGDDPKEGEKDK